MAESKSSSDSATAPGAEPGGKRPEDMPILELDDLGDKPVTVTLTQHWSAPGTEENLLPGRRVKVHPDLAQSLLHGGYAKLADAKK